MSTVAAQVDRPPRASSTGRLILVPAVITLAITLVRLVGELQGWSATLFSRAPGGGGSLVGISWLVPVFGAWFGWVLARAGAWPSRLARAIGLTLLAIATVPVVGIVAGRLGLGQTDLRLLWVYAAGAIVGLLVGLAAWPALGRTLVAYAFAARVPVAIVMLLAMLGSWGTHYDAAPPDFPAMSTWAKWFTIGVLPQMTIWIWFTVAVGLLFGLIAAAIGRRPGAAA